jgi:hypothetical protein
VYGQFQLHTEQCRADNEARRAEAENREDARRVATETRVEARRIAEETRRNLDMARSFYML